MVGSLASRANALNASSSKKKRFIGMGLPFDYSDQKVKFNLEVVEENSRAHLDLSDKKSNYRKNALQESCTKKIKNGVAILEGQELRQAKQKSSFASIG